jgi:hypothetical protein
MDQLCLGGESWDGLIDRLTDAACAIVPGLARAACRDLVEVMFQARVRQSDACGLHPACVPERSVWAEGPVEAPAGETSGWADPDAQAFPELFATAAADLARVPVVGRHAIQERLVGVARQILRDRLYVNRQCGRADICLVAQPVFPLTRRS